MMEGIKLFVGLGNPGPEYESTRHNVGFLWIDQICAQSRLTPSLESKFLGHVAKLKPSYSISDLLLLKPTTFMNKSGLSVSAIARFYKIKPEEILVIHDELDFSPGVCKLKKGGGHGGHNGLKDIIAQLGSSDFWRLRIGIGHPGEKHLVSNFVLHAPSKDEHRLILESMDNSCQLFDLLAQGQFEQAMLKLHS
jgi:peptidyl-tRNA hydrolase, PTH1 family